MKSMRRLFFLISIPSVSIASISIFDVIVVDVFLFPRIHFFSLSSSWKRPFSDAGLKTLTLKRVENQPPTVQHFICFFVVPPILISKLQFQCVWFYSWMHLQVLPQYYLAIDDTRWGLP